MERINKKLGFGLMRLPMKDGEVDIEQTCLMVDEFIKAGFNYFDTAHGYLSGKSEKAAKTCLTSRYPRESFILTNKLTDEYFKTNDDIRPFFESQLELCGVDYFDFYLMHAQNEARFRYFKERNAYETAIELKKEGKIRHFGISFHDRAEVLDAILSEYPQIEVVQIQEDLITKEDFVIGVVWNEEDSSELNEIPKVLVERSYFNADLSEEEINILALLMKQGWVQRQVTSIENTRMKYSGSDFKMTS